MGDRCRASTVREPGGDLRRSRGHRAWHIDKAASKNRIIRKFIFVFVVNFACLFLPKPLFFSRVSVIGSIIIMVRAFRRNNEIGSQRADAQTADVEISAVGARQLGAAPAALGVFDQAARRGNPVA